MGRATLISRLDLMEAQCLFTENAEASRVSLRWRNIGFELRFHNGWLQGKNSRKSLAPWAISCLTERILNSEIGSRIYNEYVGRPGIFINHASSYYFFKNLISCGYQQPLPRSLPLVAAVPTSTITLKPTSSSSIPGSRKETALY